MGRWPPCVSMHTARYYTLLLYATPDDKSTHFPFFPVNDPYFKKEKSTRWVLFSLSKKASLFRHRGLRPVAAHELCAVGAQSHVYRPRRVFWHAHVAPENALHFISPLRRRNSTRFFDTLQKSTRWVLFSHSQLFHTSGWLPTVAALPFLTMGVFSRVGLSRIFSILSWG